MENKIVEELDDEVINTDSAVGNSSTQYFEGPKEEVKPRTRSRKKKEIVDEDSLISCLRNERIIVRHVPKENGMITNPKHVLYGGMAENAVKYYTVPVLESGMMVNVLTNNEKEFLEEIMGLEYNALSVYKKEDNYWHNKVVRLTKQDTILDLSDPEQYIKYKILLSNKDEIAFSLQELQDHPKATYKFVIIREGEETSDAKKEMSFTMQSYMEFGKIQEDFYTLKTIIETIDGRPVSPSSKIEFLQTKVNKLIQADPKLFLKIVEDPLLPNKVIIKRAIEKGIISNRGGFLYLREDGSPLCGNNEDPTLGVAAKFIGLPKNQTIKFSLEAKLKQ